MANMRQPLVRPAESLPKIAFAQLALPAHLAQRTEQHNARGWQEQLLPKIVFVPDVLLALLLNTNLLLAETLLIERVPPVLVLLAPGPMPILAITKPRPVLPLKGNCVLLVALVFGMTYLVILLMLLMATFTKQRSAEELTWVLLVFLPTLSMT